MKTTKSPIVFLVAAVFLILAISAPADEVSSAKRVTELFSDIQKTMDKAKQESSKVKTKYASPDKSADAHNQERAKAIADFEEASEKYNRARSPETEKDVRSALLSVVRTSTDVIAALQNELLVNSRQVDIASDAISEVLVKMDSIDEALQGMGATDSPEAERLRKTALKQLRTVDQVTQVLAADNPRNPQVQQIKQTLNVQARALTAGVGHHGSLRKTLNENRKQFEHFLAQLEIAKRQLAMEKLQMSQLALGQIAWGTMNKIAILLMGNSGNIEALATNVLSAQNSRHDTMNEFMQQNERLHDTGAGGNAHGGGADAEEYPYLEQVRNDPTLD